MDNNTKIIECLLEKIGAMKNLFENEIILARMETRTNMNRHMINHHDRDAVPNSDNYLELFKVKEKEVWRLREKLYEANTKLATELIKLRQIMHNPKLPLVDDKTSKTELFHDLQDESLFDSPVGTLPQ